MKTDLIKGKPIKNIIMFSFPIMGSSLLQYCYSLVDNIIVGRYVGTDALAAVGNVGSINSFIIGAALGLTAGFTIPVAQNYGAGDYKKMNSYAGNSISLAVIIGAIVAVIAHIISYPMLRLIHTPSEIIDLSASYINIIYFCVPIQMSLNNFNALSRAVGESKKPLYFLICSVIINLFLDILFVNSFGWGVVGAAFATAISQICATILSGVYILKVNKTFNISKAEIALKKAIALKEIKIGIPLSLQFTITSIGSMVLQTAVNGFGANVIAGFTAASRAEQVLNIPMSGLGVGTMTFVAQNYGANNYSRIIKNVRRIYVLDLFVSVICSVVLISAGPHIVSLFMTDYNEEIMNAALHYLKAIAQCYSLVATLFVFRNVLQGLGFTYANTVAGAGELFGRVLVALVLTPLLGFNAICYAGPFAWLLADIPLIVIYLIKRKQLYSSEG